MTAGAHHSVPAIALAIACFLTTAAKLPADSAQDATFAHRAEAAFNETETQYRSRMDNPVTAWEYARACYDWADWATNKTQRATIAKKGIAACQQSLLLTNSAAAHYYLAMNKGQLARSETLGALKLVHDMEHEFQAAAGLEPDIDFAGPARGLGLLYRDAPGWPVSIGNRPKARNFLENAVTLAPDYPENILNLAESYLKWGDNAGAKKELKRLDDLWSAAQKSLTGQHWELSWADWTNRREVLRDKIDQ